MPNRFQVGQCVTHKDRRAMRSLVFDKILTSAGRALYQLRAVDLDDMQRDRLVLSEALEANCDCAECRFHTQTGCTATLATV